MTLKLCLAVTKRGKKTPIAVMLENYCRINVTTENIPELHLCLLQEELTGDCVKGRQFSGKVDGEGQHKPTTTIPREKYVVWR